MSRIYDHAASKRQIALETDAEIAFGAFLERSGVDCDSFMKQWRISQSQFNVISHHLYGMTSDISVLPPALAAMLAASRQIPSATVTACETALIKPSHFSYHIPVQIITHFYAQHSNPANPVNPV